jgi:hypothetical protein
VYGISGCGSYWNDDESIRIFTLALLSFFLTWFFVSPVLASVSADTTIIPQSRDTLAQDNPEFIRALKTHVAYVGQAQDARMDGVITYIDTISDGTGSGTLREIQEDYMAVASSIPVMQTADDIAGARAELQRQSRLFAEETKAQLVLFNGSTDTMRETASASMQSVEDSFTSLKNSLWLANETARLTVFNRESGQRAAVIRSLTKQGVDVTRASNISQQIDARRSDLEKALTDKSVRALVATNNGVRALNREFRTTVDGYQQELQIERKRTAILAMQ